MSFERARAHLASLGLADSVMVFERSSATVPEAAAAVGTEPARIAKTLSFLVQERPVLVVVAGDARVDNAAFRRQFGTKARMIASDRVEHLVGHAVGGVCPFGVEPGVLTYLDRSLQRFGVVYPACGSANSAVGLSLTELERACGQVEWVGVTDRSDTGAPENG